jgi:hypothetical protein
MLQDVDPLISPPFYSYYGVEYARYLHNYCGPPVPEQLAN